jgi:acetyl-CoA synthetase
VVEADGTSRSVTYAQMSARSSQVASWLSSLGAAKGDRLLLMLGNQVELWETLLGCIKLGVVVIPATTLLTSADLNDRGQAGSRWTRRRRVVRR